MRYATPAVILVSLKQINIRYRLTLIAGDERPCLRCVKRGLQDQCHDGVRKKAKYLHDAPPEALVPGYAANYLNGSHNMPTLPGASQIGSNGLPVSQSGAFYGSNPTGSYPQYSPLSQQGQMGPPVLENANMIGDQPAFGSPTQFQPTSGQQVSPAQDLSATMDSSTMASVANTYFDSPFIDPNDPSLFNFNISDMNFGNHYGALEFGMLGHMSSGAVNTPDLDLMNMGQHGSVSYDGQPAFGFGYGDQFQPWQAISDSGSRQGSTTNLWAMQNSGVEAFAVGQNANSFTGTSPHSQNQDYTASYPPSTLSPETQFSHPDNHQQTDASRQNTSQPQQRSRKPAPFPNDMNQYPFKKRRKDTSEIYASVTKPHNYTQGFHQLTAHLNSKYGSANVAEIAKALASIRPSFIASNKNLNQHDLIFMEKGFQRSLYEQDDHFAATGTPSLACRRTGEVALVNKEFSLVTGWRRDVLVGKEPNLNVNLASSKPGSQTGGSNTRGTSTPRIPNVEATPGQPQAVLLAELMDEDSFVQFYRDFSELAFGAARSSVIRRVCLVKYKTKDDPGWRPEDRLGSEATVSPQRNTKPEPLIKGEAGMQALGGKDGKVECMMTWTVKRDIFETPMMIVMNVSLLSYVGNARWLLMTFSSFLSYLEDDLEDD